MFQAVRTSHPWTESDGEGNKQLGYWPLAHWWFPKVWYKSFSGNEELRNIRLLSTYYCGSLLQIVNAIRLLSFLCNILHAKHAIFLPKIMLYNNYNIIIIWNQILQSAIRLLSDLSHPVLINVCLLDFFGGWHICVISFELLHDISWISICNETRSFEWMWQKLGCFAISDTNSSHVHW